MTSLEWVKDSATKWSGLQRTGWRADVAHVIKAKAGEAEGGMGALARLMMSSKGIKSPPLSPAGWYWQGTIHERGVWTSPAGPYKTAAAAIKAADAAFRKGAYSKRENPKRKPRGPKYRPNPKKRRVSRDWKPASSRLVQRVGVMKIYRDTDWNQFVIVPPGAKSDKRAAFEDNLKDAIGTAAEMDRRSKR